MQELWNQLLDLIARVVIPDWKSIIDLIPLIGLPLLALWVAWSFGRLTLFDLAHRPRAAAERPGGRAAPRQADGGYDFPAGVPFCATHGLVYPTSARTCDLDGAELDVRCPADGTVRPVAAELCRTCGTRYRLGAAPDARMLLAAAAGPPPGGAAAA